MVVLKVRETLSEKKKLVKLLKTIAYWYIVGDKIDVKDGDKLILECANDDANFEEADDGNTSKETIELAKPFCVKFSINVLVF